MSNRDILASGASAGAFRPDFPAAVLITLHLSCEFRSSLDEVLTRAGPNVIRAAIRRMDDLAARSLYK